MLLSGGQCVSSNDWSSLHDDLDGLDGLLVLLLRIHKCTHRHTSLHENIQNRPFPARLPSIYNLSKQSSAAGLRACVASSCIELGTLGLFQRGFERGKRLLLAACLSSDELCDSQPLWSELFPEKAAFSGLKWPSSMAGSCSSGGQELWELGQLAFYQRCFSAGPEPQPLHYLTPSSPVYHCSPIVSTTVFFFSISCGIILTSTTQFLVPFFGSFFAIL